MTENETTPAEQPKKPRRGGRKGMQEARSSWNTIYLDRNGFECQITLRDEDENALAERVSAITEHILGAGGAPVTRRSRSGMPPYEANSNAGSQESLEKSNEKTYVDRKGVRRCNLKLNNGRRCNQPVTEKEGRYGLFWSCPNYKEHAPPPGR